jgi:hypothetical protein
MAWPLNLKINGSGESAGLKKEKNKRVRRVGRVRRGKNGLQLGNEDEPFIW